ncbi:hypothetical protein [Parasitella parasitica]|uniref:HTH psq-type domain-containing protein n=1 Tax=Parasitella parasitica TaxID=35722 RepID=A0A0B7NFS8_9FUNG|nr:hypothetical protein [Parasitella parasitica]
MTRTLSSQTHKTTKKEIPSNIRELIIEQVVMEGKISQAEAARRYNIPPTSIRNILDAWYNEGRIHAKRRGGKRKEVTKFEDKHGRYIQELLDEDCTRTLDMIKEELQAKFPELADKGISASGLWRFLTERIGFTLKRTKAVEERRNSPETIEQRYDYVVKRLPERGISYKTNCIFVDEAGFNANLIRGQGYSKKGSASVVVNASKRAVIISILAGISYHGVEDVSVKIVKGGTTGSIFKLFVYQIMKKLDETNAGPHFFVMDNARDPYHP